MIKLIIFDMDGLVLDSEKVYFDCAKVVSNQHNYHIPDSILYNTMGTNYQKTIELFHETMGAGFPVNVFLEQYYDYLKNHKSEHLIRVKPGFFELIQYLKKERVLTALATGSSKEKAIDKLNEAEIDYNIFDFMIFGNEIENSKPDPEIFIKTILHFRLTAEETIVFEDSQNGLIAAVNGGFKCILVPDISPISKENMSKAYRIIPSLKDAISIIEELNKARY